MAEIGDPEACDWCGRSGHIIQHDYWRDGRLECRNPSLCDVCQLLYDADSGEIGDAFSEVRADFWERLERFDAELARKWSDKVSKGQRERPGDDEPPPVHLMKMTRRAPPDEPRQLRGEEALHALSEADRRGLLPAEASNLLTSLVAAGTPAQETVDAVMLVLGRLYPDA